MTGRIRSIKPEFFQHSDLWECENELGPDYKGLVRLTFAALWTQVDREGRFKWKPRELKLRCLPYDNCDFEVIMGVLAKHSFLSHYTVDGNAYGWIPSFKRNQSPNHRESASVLPEPPAAEPMQGSLFPFIDKGKGKEGRGGEGGVASTPEPGSDAVPTASEVDNTKELTEEKKVMSIEFLCSGKKKKGKSQVWHCPLNLVTQWEEAYPGVDVYGELKKAAAWCLSNPSGRKTTSGMPAFLNRWLSSEQNRGHGRRNSSPVSRKPTEPINPFED